MSLTETEKIILENTDEKYKYIARDFDGCLYIYCEKPLKRDRQWYLDFAYSAFTHYNHLFQDIKWEDDEPYKFR